jgi:hypothetical protein
MVNLIKEFIELNKIYLELQEMLITINNMLYANTSDDTGRIYETFNIMYSTKYPQSRIFPNKHLYGLTMNQNEGNIPKTSNLSEKLNVQLSRRFKTIEVFHTFTTAFKHLNMICNYLRFKPYIL